MLVNSAGEQRLEQAVQSDWLDAVVVANISGTIVGTASNVSLEQLLGVEAFRAGSLQTLPRFRAMLEQGKDEDIAFVFRSGRQLEGGGLVIARSIRSERGEWLGVAIGILSNRSLHAVWRQAEARGFDLGDDGLVSLYDTASRKLLYRSDLKLGGKAAPLGVALPVQAYDPTGSNSELKYHVSPVDGIERLVVLTPALNGQWILEVGLGKHEFLRGWYWQIAISAAIFLLLAALQWQLVNIMQRNQEQREQLAHESRHDPLTGLANRRHFSEWVKNICGQSRRYVQPLTVLALDLDHFKSINDRWGHDGGDQVLIRTAEVLRAALRECDLPARFGGEEFIVVLPQTPLAGAMQVAERIRADIEALVVYYDGDEIRFTVSIGVTEVAAAEKNVEAALNRADEALYQAKQAGRNCVLVHGPRAAPPAEDLAGTEAEVRE
ncbi:sensor domain-containing diguanylate cyclase [Chitinilyticum aquatile]|uniref:sensor domain-containing diguanylate cyclase n=1 Tax=Chitinilyticum aquatile TaxID=362520 RepID=UPI000424B900|nr:diguanylate cyclase [Chitinilyticum aquatile]